MLSADLPRTLWSSYGPFALNLMALPSNALRSPSGMRLPCFLRELHPSAAGVNVFSQPCLKGRLYAFPPFGLISPLIKLFVELGSVEVVMVLPVFPLRPGPWASLLRPYVPQWFVYKVNGEECPALFFIIIHLLVFAHAL